MTDLNQQQILFGSGTPNGNQLALTAAFQEAHKATAGADGQVDLVSCEVANPTAGAIELTVGWAGQAAGDTIVVSIPAKSGVVLVLDRRPLAKGQSVWLKGNGLNAFTYVGRLS